MSNFVKCLELILHHEGGYVDHPDDPGGETNLGVTKRVYEDFGGEKEMKDLTKDKLLIQSEDLISRGFLDDISIFQTHDSKFYKTKSFENWIF